MISFVKNTLGCVFVDKVIIGDQPLDFFGRGGEGGHLVSSVILLFCFAKMLQESNFIKMQKLEVGT